MLAMLLVLLTAGSVPAAASDTRVPFVAFYSMHPLMVGVDDNGCNLQQLPGEGRATHLRDSTFYSDAKACPGTWVQSGDGVWTAANGDHLFGEFLGTFRIVMTADGPTAEFEGAYDIHAGDGQFDGYTGTGVYWGSALIGQNPGAGELYFLGTLTRP
jgi:hypothetical protein